MSFNGLTARDSKPSFGTPINYDNPITRGLVGAWAFNEGSGSTTAINSADSSSGTVTGVTFTGNEAVFASGNRVDAGTHYIHGVEFTIISKIKTTATSYSTVIGQHQDVANERFIWMMASSGQMVLYFGGSNLAPTVAVNDGTYHTVAHARTSSGLCVGYKDGIASGTTANDTTAITGSVNTWVGNDQSNDPFVGSMEYVLIFNRALSPSEVASLSANPWQIYEGVRSRLLPRIFTQKPPVGTGIDWNHPLANGLVGCWLFNEGGGLIADLAKGKLSSSNVTQTTDGVSANGTTQYLNTNSKAFDDYPIVTIFSKINMPSIANGTGAIIAGARCSSGWLFQIRNIGSSSYFRTTHFGVADLDSSSFSVAANTPLSVTAVVGGNNSFYVNGKFVSNGGAMSIGACNPKIPYYMFAANDSDMPQWYTAYTMYVTLLYNRALDASEIKSLHENPYQFCLAPPQPEHLIELPITKLRGGRR